MGVERAGDVLEPGALLGQRDHGRSSLAGRVRAGEGEVNRDVPSVT